MDLTIFTQYIDIVILGICLCVGFVVKKWIKDVDNKFIPTIVCVLGLILKVSTNGLSLEVIFAGMISGLASTGLYEAFRNFLKIEEESKND